MSVPSTPERLTHLQFFSKFKFIFGLDILTQENNKTHISQQKDKTELALKM